MIDVVEVCEVGIYLGDPVWDGEYDSADEESTPPFRQKRPQLHPGDYIVEDPRRVQRYGRDGEPPGVDRLIE